MTGTGTETMSQATPIPRSQRKEKRRLFYGTLSRLNPSAERRVEMLVDRVCSRGHAMQFWQDCMVYGLYEAYIYAHKSCYAAAKDGEWANLHRLVNTAVEATLALSDKRPPIGRK